jgi:CBS domain-containing protein
MTSPTLAEHNDDSAHLPSFERATVADAMHPGVLSCLPETPLADVARLMATHHVHGVVVDGVARDKAGRERLVWGVVSDLDLVGAKCAAGAERTAASMSATPAVVVAPEDRLSEAARILHESDVHHLVVVSSGDGRPVGILSTLDIAGVIASGR